MTFPNRPNSSPQNSAVSARLVPHIEIHGNVPRAEMYLKLHYARRKTPDTRVVDHEQDKFLLTEMVMEKHSVATVTVILLTDGGVAKREVA